MTSQPSIPPGELREAWLLRRDVGAPLPAKAGAAGLDVPREGQMVFAAPPSPGTGLWCQTRSEFQLLLLGVHPESRGWLGSPPGLSAPLEHLPWQLHGFLNSSFFAFFCPFFPFSPSPNLGLFIWRLSRACRQRNFWCRFITVRQHLRCRLERSSPLTAPAATCNRRRSCQGQLGTCWILLQIQEMNVALKSSLVQLCSVICPSQTSTCCVFPSFEEQGGSCSGECFSPGENILTPSPGFAVSAGEGNVFVCLLLLEAEFEYFPWS